MSDPYVLILYYSRTQGTQNLALHMARGVDQVAGIEPRIRTVPPVSAVTERTAPSVPDDGAVFCTKEDLIGCSGLARAVPPDLATWPHRSSIFSIPRPISGLVTIWLASPPVFSVLPVPYTAAKKARCSP